MSIPSDVRGESNVIPIADHFSRPRKRSDDDTRLIGARILYLIPPENPTDEEAEELIRLDIELMNDIYSKVVQPVIDKLEKVDQPEYLDAAEEVSMKCVDILWNSDHSDVEALTEKVRKKAEEILRRTDKKLYSYYIQSPLKLVE